MLFSLANKAVAQKTLREMQERHADMKSIERSIVDLHQLFLEIQIIVDQQGEQLDRLESFVGDIEGATEHAVGEMQGAVQKKKSAQRRKWILILIVLVLLGVVGMVLGITLTNNKS